MAPTKEQLFDKAIRSAARLARDLEILGLFLAGTPEEIMVQLQALQNSKDWDGQGLAQQVAS